MKKITLRILTLITTSLFAQNQGDIAFVGYNGDGNDDFAIVTFVDIPENSTIYFTDGEPNASGNGIIDDSEGVITWSTGDAVILAGTVVTFTDIGNDTNPLYGASIGVIDRSEAGFGLSVGADGDNIFATLGNPTTNNITIWLTGIEVHDNGRPSNFSQTGLTVGENFLVIDDTQSKDGGQYTGLRTGKTISEYKILVNNEENWTTDTSNGELFVPFDSTMFEMTTLTTNVNVIEGLIVSVEDQKIITNLGEIIHVRNMLGQQVLNQNLVKGIYIVTVKKGNKFFNYKIAI